MKRLGIDIGSTTVKVAVIDEQHNILFSDYQRHFAKIQETLSSLLKKAKDQIGEMTFAPTVTGSGGLSISSYLDIPFCQEVVCVSSALQDYAPQTDVAIELGGEDAKIIYFTNGIDQRMNGVCAVCTLRAQDGGDLPRQLLVRAARGECRLGVRDVRDLRQRRDEQALRIGQAARPARLHGADGGRTGPCFVIARTVLAADRADALGEFQLRRFEPDIFRQRQLRQLRLDRGTVHALSSRFRYSRS